VSVPIQHDVVRLEVSVDDSVLVEVVKCSHSFTNVKPGLVLFKCSDVIKVRGEVSP